ncbi:c-type cytochrome [Desulfuromonas sp. KJ2020]|uniref:cytochrome c n=1 Tax=Desulfuromonas sp. KJ2020 TaxID=2919173 RepID=UPI0020A81D9B|nr:c-type cytochrome [Desulfuromonas sp. KJ2020]MCP3178232.1 c-type cytochrome [Desulfuromonas sp. KJ2020]
MKRVMKMTALLLGLFVLAAPVLAASDAGGRGRYLFRKECRTCHGTDGRSVALTPQSRKADEWRAFFESEPKQNHTEAWQNIGDRNLEKIKEFVVLNASDVFSSKAADCWDPK